MSESMPVRARERAGLGFLHKAAPGEGGSALVEVLVELPFQDHQLHSQLVNLSLISQTLMGCIHCSGSHCKL